MMPPPSCILAMGLRIADEWDTEKRFPIQNRAAASLSHVTVSLWSI